ncbi:MAG: hypothetical protein ACJ76B_11785 [Solirubrobacterales bacterium]
MDHLPFERKLDGEAQIGVPAGFPVEAAVGVGEPERSAFELQLGARAWRQQQRPE